MSVAPIPVVTDFSYTELKERVEVLSRRVNSLTAMEVSLIDIDQTPSINITEDNSLLKLPDLSQIDCEELAEDLIACDEALVIAQADLESAEEAVEDLTEIICVNNDAIKQLTGLDVKVGGYFEVRNATASYQITGRDPVPVEVTFIVYQKPDDSYKISYDSTTASSNAVWILEGDGVNLGGPYQGNVSSDAAWVFNVGVNCNIPLNIKVYNKLWPTFTATAPVSQLPCSDDFVDICAP